MSGFGPFSSPPAISGGYTPQNARVAKANKILAVVTEISSLRQDASLNKWLGLDKTLTDKSAVENIVAVANGFYNEQEVQREIVSFRNAVHNYELNLPYSKDLQFPQAPEILAAYVAELGVAF